MKVTHNVRSTNPNIQELEVNVDTVYKRYDVTEIINEDGNKEFNIGREEEYEIKEFIKLMSEENSNLKTNLDDAILELSMLISMGGM